jgi:hypothetical protein
LRKSVRKWGLFRLLNYIETSEKFIPFDKFRVIIAFQVSSRIFNLDADPAGAGQHDITGVRYDTCHSEFISESPYSYEENNIEITVRRSPAWPADRERQVQEIP